MKRPTCFVGYSSSLLRALTSIVAAWPLLAGCGADDLAEPPEAIGKVTEDIVGGVPSPPERNSTVFVLYNSEETGEYRSCAGALVAANVVFVPRTCVSEIAPAAFTCHANGEPVDDGNGGGYLVADFKPEEFGVFEGEMRPAFDAQPTATVRRILHDGSNVLCAHDFAILILDAPLSVPFAPVRLNEQVKLGELLTVAGWGSSEGSFGEEQRRERANVPVHHVSPLSIDPKATGSEAPRSFVTGPAICLGDVGAVAYAASGAVVGINSTVRGLNFSTGSNDPAAPCTPATAQGVFYQVAGFPDLIAEAFEAAGAEPWLENGPDPRLAKFGERCEKGSECRSNLCSDGSDGPRYCTAACSESEPCPTGYECASGASPVCRGSAAAPAAASGERTAAAGSGACSTSPGAPASGAVGLAAAGLAYALVRRRFGPSRA